MNRVPFFAILLYCLFPAPPAPANDGPVYFTGGPGGGLAPKHETDIEMVREHLVLRERPDTNAWKATCHFTFHNTAANSVRTRVGFPYRVVPDDYPSRSIDSAFRAPEGFPDPDEHGDPLVFDFKVWIRGDRVTDVRRGQFAATEQLELRQHQLYTWTMTLDAGETVRVRNEYLQARSTHTGRGRGEMTTTDLVDYITQTGGLWKGGEIGEATFEIHPRRGHFPCAPADLTPEGPEITRKPMVPLDRTDQFDEEVDARYRIRWHLENFSTGPNDDIDLELCSREDLAAKLRMTYGDVYPSPEDLADGITADQSLEAALRQLRIGRNKFYALEGYRFDSDTLADHFASTIWYLPDPDFSPDELSDREVETMERIKKAEAVLRKRLTAKRDVPEPGPDAADRMGTTVPAGATRAQ
ncbi:MAG: YARHG domain-containing protein [Bradymonadaceae bacterium]